MATAICFIEKARQQRPLVLGGGDDAFESGNWDVSATKAASLIGAKIYFHQAQATPSYFGGTINGYRVLPPDHPTAPGRVVFAFTREETAKGFDASEAKWGREQATIS